MMKKYKISTKMIISLLLVNFFSVTALANSSWCWATETLPYHLLPIVIIFTLVTETAMITKNTNANIFKVFTFVSVGNLLSYLLPYVEIYYNTPPYSGTFTLQEIIRRGPVYSIGFWFLVVTLIVELPTVYLFLKKNDVKGKLVRAIIYSNILTTLFVAILERIVCRGNW